MLLWPIRDGVVLQLPEESLASDILNVIERNRERLQEFVHWAHFTNTVEDVLAFVRFARSEFQRPDALHFLIICEDQVSGGCGLHIRDHVAGAAEIGYWLDAAWVGKGIATDCTRALIDYGFRHLALNRIQIRCSPDNLRSSAVPQRLGFTYEGTLRQINRVGDRLLDNACYSMLRKEWPLC